MDNYIDPKELLGEIQQNWRDVYDSSVSRYEATYRLLGGCVALPEYQTQLPNLVVHLWTNVKWSQVLPILFCYGREGSGKSTALRVCSALHDSELFNGEVSTFASMRNHLMQKKYIDESMEFEADGACLLYDNCGVDTFAKDADKLNLMLGGYNKATDSCSIAIPGAGENMVFRTAATRIISSVEPIHAAYQLREFRRRMTYCFHETLDYLPQESIDFYEACGAHDIDTINWSGFDDVYHNFWGNKANCMVYAQHLKRMRRPKAIESRQWEYTKYLIATGLAIGAWSDTTEAYRYYEGYFEYVKASTSSSEGTLEVYAREFLAKLEEPESFENSLLMQHLEQKVREKYFLEKPKAKEIESTFLARGYKLSKGVWHKQG
ncbi:MAG: hypothetical protein AAFW84_19975 [Cyanobacteria bacterium J06635_15]